MMGMFHWVNILLKCAGRYLRGSGIEDALIELECLANLDTYKQYYRRQSLCCSFRGMYGSNLISSLALESFWQDRGSTVNNAVLACGRDIERPLCQKQGSIENFKTFADLFSEPQDQFDKFLKECCAKSEVRQYLQTSQHIATAIKHIVSSDREGNFPLHNYSQR